MDTEARRIMAVSISKLYTLRTQRGGLRLHRSLLLSMTMRAARDIYHAAVLTREQQEQVVPTGVRQDPVQDPPGKGGSEEDKENQGSRKRRCKTSEDAEMPSKKERMDADEEVLKNSCRTNESLTAFPTNRAMVAC